MTTEPSTELKKRQQALVSVDKIEEALSRGDYEEAAAAVENLRERVEEIEEVGD